MNDTELLTRLVAHQYDAQAVTLQPIHQFVVEGRGIYRVERAGKPPWLLRAFRHAGADFVKQLVNSAAALCFLEQQGYPAPSLIRTTAGALVGRYQDWSALMVTFVEGVMAQSTLENWGRLGALLGQLHNLDVASAPAARPPVRGSRFQPGGVISELLERLRAIARQVPAELQTLYDVCMDLCQRVDQWRHAPLALLHTDCWLNNAIQTPQGELVLVDWDGAGLGPAALDLGYLLVACHCYLPEWPQLAPNADYIGAVVDGYCRQRRLTPAELELLPDAVRFSIIYHDARDFPQMIQDERLKARNLERFYVRYPAAEEIAYLGRVRFEI